MHQHPGLLVQIAPTDRLVLIGRNRQLHRSFVAADRRECRGPFSSVCGVVLIMRGLLLSLFGAPAGAPGASTPGARSEAGDGQGGGTERAFGAFRDRVSWARRIANAAWRACV
jgi:hypothetical protein